MLASASRMGDGVARNSSGSFTGDGTAVTLKLGFNPQQIILVNQTDVLVYEKLSPMAAANCLKTVGSTGVTTLDTGSAIVFNGDGTVTISAATNVAAKSFVFLAQ